MSTLNSNQSSNVEVKDDGSLNVTILSAYDLPGREHPLGVEVSCLNKSALTDQPSARHKDKNSFKFGKTIKLVAPLRDLYKTTAKLTLKYRAQEKNLCATIQLNTLKVNERTWLVLNFGEINNNDDEVIPTLRVQVELQGPYRAEIATILNMAKVWFGTVDKTQTNLSNVAKNLPLMSHVSSFDPKYLLAPSVPLVTGVVVVTPIVLGVLIVFLPFLLPVLAVVLATILAGSGVGFGLYASTKAGRNWLGDMVSPAVHTFLATPSGQSMVYETGPRPTPVSLARSVLPVGWKGKLFTSLLIDLIGSSSYLLPVVGEAFDLTWAPIQTVLIMAMYDAVSPNLKYVSFVEEILPFTDVLPSATIGWACEFGIPMIYGPEPSKSSLAVSNTNALLQTQLQNASKTK
mmetsp:Transcript_16725/g.25271  ORF Transcript_16725/g.25271 Transcript_16725/m.25271 type:complete len:403 (+) Transcript_16725:337-1545(+)|eukprot:CAMPEP_0178907944 /NCGR_PEP_ID=MMETSP0786-20121207/7648_1 /TAXON_ID=186022 /ORGANISM="Thalassionema frauenfeldii, Strain CCMP 1798" /LENGTH=402 /DNA_ID=CAMNT_0020579791 /DNA_START=227 /DNA_END=1435 /DNA_ORIENTATION=-